MDKDIDELLDTWYKLLKEKLNNSGFQFYVCLISRPENEKNLIN